MSAIIAVWGRAGPQDVVVHLPSSVLLRLARDRRAKPQARSATPLAPLSDAAGLDACAQQPADGAAGLRRHARVLFHRGRPPRRVRPAVGHAAVDRVALGRSMRAGRPATVWCFSSRPEPHGAAREGRHRSAWQLPFDRKARRPPRVGQRLAGRGDADRTCSPFAASDGQLIWRRDLGVAGARACQRSPAIACTCRWPTAASSRCDVDNGELVWERRLGGPPNEILALDDRLYVGSNDNYLLLPDDQRWPRRLALADRRRRRRRCRCRRDHVYFVSLDNVLRALNRKSGVQRWKRRAAVPAGVGADHRWPTPSSSPVRRRACAPSRSRTASGRRSVDAAAEIAAAAHVFEIRRPALPDAVDRHAQHARREAGRRWSRAASNRRALRSAPPNPPITPAAAAAEPRLTEARRRPLDQAGCPRSARPDDASPSRASAAAGDWP